MSQRYSPSPEERRALERLAEEVAGVQQALVTNHPQLAQPDRAAHQPQLGAGKVLLRVNDLLPPELAGLGIFAPTGPRRASASAASRTGSGVRTLRPTPTSSA